MERIELWLRGVLEKRWLFSRVFSVSNIFLKRLFSVVYHRITGFICLTTFRNCLSLFSKILANYLFKKLPSKFVMPFLMVNLPNLI